MPKTKLCSLLFALLLASCVKYANQYAPDRERRPDVTGDPRGLAPFFTMKDERAHRHFAGGMDAGAFDGEFRKGGTLVQLRFAADARQAWKFQLKYRSATAQRVAVRLNGATLGEFDAEGVGQWSAPAPGSLFVADTAALVEILSAQGLAIAEAGFARP